MSMREHIAEVIVGALVIALAAVFLTWSVSTSGSRAGGGYPLTATFTNVNGLAVGSDVRLAGVKIGSVATITINPQSFAAEVEMRITDAVPIPSDSLPALRSDGLLGGVHLAIEPGGAAEVLEAGDRFEYPGQGAIDVLRLMADFVGSGSE
jgi:phospholipid/cholesterol/gamma-HCH transport system substrate-binding protein